MIDVLAREQELRDRQLMGIKRVCPHVHQPPLPDRGNRLQLGQVGRSLHEI